MNQNGVYLPLLSDKGRGSYTLTMFWITFNIAIITLVGKVTKLLDGVDYSNVLWLLGLTGSFYLGRRIQGDKNGFSVDGVTNTTNTVNTTTTTSEMQQTTTGDSI